MPDDDMPLLIDSTPDEPAEPTFAECTNTEPDPDDKLEPDPISTSPPRATDRAVPADAITPPPTPLSPLPTTTLMAPPDPPLALPDNSDNQPLLPDDDAPLLNTNVPDAPLEPTFPLETTIEPELQLTLDPDVITTAPPTPLPLACPPLNDTRPPLPADDVVWPAATTIAPPTPLLPLPTTTLIEPP